MRAILAETRPQCPGSPSLATVAAEDVRTRAPGRPRETTTSGTLRRLAAAATLSLIALVPAAAPLAPAAIPEPAPVVAAAPVAPTVLAADRAQRGLPAASRSMPRLAPSRASVAVFFALAQQGRPYRFGASGPRAYDCSGLVLAAWARVGVRLPHSAAGIARRGYRVQLSQLRPGDVLVYARRGRVYHVALYVGGGWMVEAPHHGVPVRRVRIWRPSWAVRIG